MKNFGLGKVPWYGPGGGPTIYMGWGEPGCIVIWGGMLCLGFIKVPDTLLACNNQKCVMNLNKDSSITYLSVHHRMIQVFSRSGQWFGMHFVLLLFLFGWWWRYCNWLGYLSWSGWSTQCRGCVNVVDSIQIVLTTCPNLQLSFFKHIKNIIVFRHTLWFSSPL